MTRPHNRTALEVLVDRVWPRGISKEAAAIDLWMNAIAPSTNLQMVQSRSKTLGVRKRYRTELQLHASELDELRRHAAKRRLTLLFGARDTEHNQAVVLKEVLAGK